MSIITVQDIQRELLDFLRRLEADKSFLVVRDDHALAEVRPVSAPAIQPRPFGLCAGRFTAPPDFDRPLPEEILKDFEAA